MYVYCLLDTYEYIYHTLILFYQGGLGFFATMYQIVKTTDPHLKNPAVNREMNQVGENPVELGGWKKLVVD